MDFYALSIRKVTEGTLIGGHESLSVFLGADPGEANCSRDTNDGARGRVKASRKIMLCLRDKTPAQLITGGFDMLPVAEAEPLIVAEWHSWKKQQSASPANMLTFYFTWLPENRPELLRFRCKRTHDKWQKVRGWIQYADDKSI